jgi:uncharacterized protein
MPPRAKARRYNDLLLVALLLALPACHSKAAPIAPAVDAQHQLSFTGLVVDQAEVLDAAVQQRLTARLTELQHTTGHQMAVVTVSSLDGQDIEPFTKSLANRWGVGRAGGDDGVVLLVAPNERKVRIAVGFGLEQTLTNEFCADVIQRQVLPQFRRGAMAAGIEAGVAELSRKLIASRTAAQASHSR